MFLKKKNASKFNSPRKLVTEINPLSFISEQYRMIRTSIEFSTSDRNIETILVTSSIPGEGKSTTTANLGVVFAQQGKKVLIVDADMRKPTLHYTFNLPNSVGLSNILTKQNSVYTAIQNTNIENLHILTSGVIPPNTAELLSSNNLVTFISEVKKEYEIIIFDSPPLLSATDAQILSNKCDGTLIIVNRGVVDKADVTKAKAILEAVHSNILGVVLNNYKLSKNKSYYYY